MRTVFTVAIACVLMLASAFGQSGLATVSGTVHDSYGKPDGGASVTAIPLGEGGAFGTVQWSRTDEHGAFRFALQAGRYVFLAKHEEAGSPDPMILLSHDPRNYFPEISIGSVNISGIEVRLAPKGGFIEGDVVDETTGTPIPSGKVVIRDPRNPVADVRLTTDRMGHFEFAVPNKAVVISATALGYSVRQFQNGAELTLSGGRRQHVELKLGKSSNNPH